MRVNDDTSDQTPAPDQEPEQDAPRWQWVVIDTMNGPEQATLLLDGHTPRGFSRLQRASLTRNGTVTRTLPILIREVYNRAQTVTKYFPVGPDEMLHRLIGVPILGPRDEVHAVAAWAGPVNEPLPRMPILGTLSWTAAGMLSLSPAAQFLFRSPTGDLLDGHTIPQMLSHFDIWSDRSTFLSLFNLPPETPVDQWHGTATRTYENGEPHDLFVAARAQGTGPERTVRAVVADITGATDQARPDLALGAIRHMPIPPGHALALVDLKTGFIHEWLTATTSPLTAWRHHNPDFNDDDRMQIAEACFALATGARDTTTMQVRTRLAPTEPWIMLGATWTRIVAGDRPQALIDITPLSEFPIPAVADCPLCQEMTHPTTPEQP